MTWTEIATMGSVASAATVVLSFVFRALRVIQRNHLVHLDSKLDRIWDKVESSQKTIERVENKLDEHIAYHLTLKE